MNDETALTLRPNMSIADVAALADEYAQATRLTRYHEGLRDETIRRQKKDLLTFAWFLAALARSQATSITI